MLQRTCKLCSFQLCTASIFKHRGGPEVLRNAHFMEIILCTFQSHNNHDIHDELFEPRPNTACIRQTSSASDKLHLILISGRKLTRVKWRTWFFLIKGYLDKIVRSPWSWGTFFMIYFQKMGNSGTWKISQCSQKLLRGQGFCTLCAFSFFWAIIRKSQEKENS
jgi:hypothetical protein